MMTQSLVYQAQATKNMMVAKRDVLSMMVFLGSNYIHLVFVLGGFWFGQCCPYRKMHFLLFVAYEHGVDAQNIFLVLENTTMIYHTILQIYCT